MTNTNFQHTSVCIEDVSNNKEVTKSSIYPTISEDINSRISFINPGFNQCAKGVITPRISRSLYAEQLLSFIKFHRPYFDVEKNGKLVWWKANKSIPMELINDWWNQSEFKNTPRLDLFGTTVPYNEEDSRIKAPDMVLEWKLSEEPNTVPGSLLGDIEAVFAGQLSVGCEYLQASRVYYTDDAGEVYSKYKLSTNYDYVWEQEYHHGLHFCAHGGILDNVEMFEFNKNITRLLKALYRHHINVDAKVFIPGVFYHQSIQEALSFAKDIPALKAKIKLIQKKKEVKYYFDFTKHPLWNKVERQYKQWLDKRNNYNWLSAALTLEERKDMEWIHSMVTIS